MVLACEAAVRAATVDGSLRDRRSCGPPVKAFKLAQRRDRGLDALGDAREIVAATGVVIVPEAKAGRCGVAFDWHQGFEHKVPQEGCAGVRNLLRRFGVIAHRGLDLSGGPASGLQTNS